MHATVTYIGGPTALIDIAGLRLLTDPTFDDAGTDYPAPKYTLHKTGSPAIDAAALGRIDAVLLSHDHHADNLDHAGRALLADMPRVLTTQAAAMRLGGRVLGLAPWEAVELPAGDGSTLRIIATPARHGPVDADRGPVIGFVLAVDSPERPVVYVSGDTVWYDGVAEVAQRFRVGLALLFTGAARVREVGPAHLTLTAQEAVTAARAFAEASIAPLHYEGWAHFCESRTDLDAAFTAAGLGGRLAWLPRGRPRSFALAAEPTRETERA
jgi:L-ascorbate metabolism protein UlaG (beta-lactamase superfamily)